MTRAVNLLSAILAGGGLMLAVFAPPASAHSLSVARIEIDARADRASSDTPATSGEQIPVELDLALRDLALSLPLDADHDERVTWGELQQARPALERMAMRGVSLYAGARACAWSPRGLAVRRYDDGAYASLRLEARCPSRDSLRLHYDLLFDRDPQHRALATYGADAARAVAVIGADRRDLVLGTRDARPFAEFLGEGVRHILIGYDHLAFLLSLLLPAALVRFRGEWQPQSNPRAAVVQVAGIVTAFTAAHSVTLSLAALGWVTPAARGVEAAIALSVLLAAVNNLRGWVTGRLWAMGFGFGLIHGFGFAGALGELGLPRDGRLWSLLGFNLGVEAGQLAVVCAVLPVLFLVRNRDWYARWVMPGASLTIAALAAVWIWQRTML